MGKQSFSFLPSCYNFRFFVLSFISIRSHISVVEVQHVCFEGGGGMGMQDEEEGGGGEAPATADGFRLLAFYQCYEMLVWSEGMEVLVTEGVASDMA